MMTAPEGKRLIAKMSEVRAVGNASTHLADCPVLSFVFICWVSVNNHHQTFAHSPMEVTFLVTEIRLSPVSLHSCPSTMQSEIQGGRQWLDLANKTRRRRDILWKPDFLRTETILGWRRGKRWICWPQNPPPRHWPYYLFQVVDNWHALSFSWGLVASCGVHKYQINLQNMKDVIAGQSRL